MNGNLSVEILAMILSEEFKNYWGVIDESTFKAARTPPNPELEVFGFDDCKAMRAVLQRVVDRLNTEPKLDTLKVMDGLGAEFVTCTLCGVLTHIRENGVSRMVSVHKVNCPKYAD